MPSTGNLFCTRRRAAQRGGATVFAVGTELDRTLHREAQWREIIAAVRTVYDGKLTYAVNWSDYEAVTFWDALDLIGIQAYYPLTAAVPPRDEELIAGWDRLIQTFRGYAEQHGKPVLLAELGYAVSTAAAAEPWSDVRVGDPAQGRALKLRCMEIGLAALADQPFIAGVYLWKWFPDNRAKPRIHAAIRRDAGGHPRSVGQNPAPHPLKPPIRRHWADPIHKKNACRGGKPAGAEEK